jgi:hypothetical protein
MMSSISRPQRRTHFDVLCGVDGAGDHVNLGFQTHAGHAQWLADAFLVVDHVILRQGVQHALVGRNRHGLGRVEYALEVGGADFAIADRDDAVGVQAADVVAGHADERRVNAAAGHQLGFFDGALDRLHGGLDVHHHALLQAAGRVSTDTDDFQVPSSPTSPPAPPPWRCRCPARRSFCRYARLPWSCLSLILRDGGLGRRRRSVPASQRRGRWRNADRCGRCGDLVFKRLVVNGNETAHLSPPDGRAPAAVRCLAGAAGTGGQEPAASLAQLQASDGKAQGRSIWLNT